MFFGALKALANNYTRITASLFVTRIDHPFSRSSVSKFEHYERRRLCRCLKIDFNETTDKIIIYAFFFLLIPPFLIIGEGASGGKTDAHALWEGGLVKSKKHCLRRPGKTVHRFG